jgi:hypothetical protein
MRPLLLVLFLFISMSSKAQLETNRPDLVYPILESFISEAHNQGIPTLNTLKFLDRITVENLDYPFYGLHIRRGLYSEIKIHAWLEFYPRRFERTLKHELGHLFGLHHVIGDLYFCEIMSEEHWEEVGPYYSIDSNWLKVNENYYKSIKQLQNEKNLNNADSTIYRSN